MAPFIVEIADPAKPIYYKPQMSAEEFEDLPYPYDEDDLDNYWLPGTTIANIRQNANMFIEPCLEYLAATVQSCVPLERPQKNIYSLRGASCGVAHGLLSFVITRFHKEGFESKCETFMLLYDLIKVVIRQLEIIARKEVNVLTAEEWWDVFYVDIPIFLSHAKLLLIGIRKADDESNTSAGKPRVIRKRVKIVGEYSPSGGPDISWTLNRLDTGWSSDRHRP